MAQKTESQARADQMDERLEGVAQIAEQFEWWDIAESIRDIRMKVRKHMHTDDRARTATVV